jgi:hypothetical protein
MNQVVFSGQVRRWGVQELCVSGPSEGNPFTEQKISAVFSGRNETVRAEGFYDGDGMYRVRFMPSFEGACHFRAEASFLPGGAEGDFTVLPAEEGNHGPVRVANAYHFAYDDGTPYFCVGTTCYAWAFGPDGRIRETLESLRQARFNKLRFCLTPKHYAYNLGEPRSYPYEGTPMDSSVLTPENYMNYSAASVGNHWDFTRFNPEHFRHLENCVRELGNIGVEADLIVMHPYDRWGFSAMTPEQDDLYWHYVTARFSAFRNVWWSLANEYDLLAAKTTEDWERFAGILCACDPYRHLRSIHSCTHFYDYGRPWITHCSIQRQDCYRTAENTDEWRRRWGKPVVLDEIAYEGDIRFGWGNLPPQEMVRRFWEGVCRGGYPSHGETYRCPENVLWWSHGGRLRGESWKRVGFLLDVVKQLPAGGLAPYPMSWDCVCAVPESEPFRPVKSCYLVYFSFMQPSERTFHLDDSTGFEAEVIDTWNMTAERLGVFRGRFTIPLPGKPYMAVLLKAVPPEK